MALAVITGGSRGFLIDAVCPNHSRTDMGGPDAPLSAAQARSLYLIELFDRGFQQSTHLLHSERIL